MKDKLILFWNRSSYLKRAILVYTVFSILAIISKLLNDGLGMISSMIAMGFFISMIAVFASIIYTLVMGINKKIAFQESFIGVSAVILFLFLISLIPLEVKQEVVVEEKKEVLNPSIHNPVTPPE